MHFVLKDFIRQNVTKNVLYLNILFLRMRNIGRAFGIVDLGGDLSLDLLVDEEEGGRVGVVTHLHLDLCAGHLW